ncbi:MAG TPA: hypothetical protein VK174_08780 [Chitinophagales bacterium]|nr:hypothetical protein [Chitinophagales bacterium]HLP51506.1 hypothetical protein [Chitinophagales bacterium]
MHSAATILCLLIAGFCAAQTEVDFHIGRNHFPVRYDFKFLKGIDTLPFNHTHKFDFKEAEGRYDSLFVMGMDFKLEGTKATIKTPLGEGQAALILYKREQQGKVKPIYVHYIRVRANRSQFE